MPMEYVLPGLNGCVAFVLQALAAKMRLPV